MEQVLKLTLQNQYMPSLRKGLSIILCILFVTGTVCIAQQYQGMEPAAYRSLSDTEMDQTIEGAALESEIPEIQIPELLKPKMNQVAKIEPLINEASTSTMSERIPNSIMPSGTASRVEETVVESPTVNKPIVNEPVAEEPMVDNPAVNNPVYTEPVSVHVTIYGNGGVPATLELDETRDAISSSWTTPKRMGKVFDGWYLDAACTEPFAGIGEDTSTLAVYAGWREFDGFVCNDSGMITSCTMSYVDGLLLFPESEECVGIESGALQGLGDGVFEIFIPSNLTYISSDAFAGLTSLMYIEAASDNPVYYSENGCLYARDGSQVFEPTGW